MKIQVRDINVSNTEINFVIKSDIAEKKFYFKFPFEIHSSALNEILLIPSTIALYIASYYENARLLMPEEMIHNNQMTKLSNYIALDNSFLTNEEIYEPNNKLRVSTVNHLHNNMKTIKSKPTIYDSLTSASGGKESLLNKTILEELGFTPLLYQVASQTIAYNRGMKPYTKSIYDQEIFVGKTNINRLKDFFPIDQNRVQNFEGLPYMLYRNAIIGIQGIWGMILAKHFDIENVFGAHEFDDYTTYKNHKFSENLTEHPIWFKYLSSVSDINYFSLLFPLNVYTELYLIDKFYYNKCKNFSSCLTQINRYCYTCDKCFSVYLMWKSLNIDPNRYDFDEQKLFKKHRLFRTHAKLEVSHFLPSIETFSFLKQNILNNLNENKQPGIELLPLYKFIDIIPNITVQNAYGYRKNMIKTIPKIFRNNIKQLIKKWNIPEAPE